MLWMELIDFNILSIAQCVYYNFDNFRFQDRKINSSRSLMICPGYQIIILLISNHFSWYYNLRKNNILIKVLK